MTGSGSRFIDPDLHVYEPGDLWQRFIEPRYRDQAPVGTNNFLLDQNVMHDGRYICRGELPSLVEDIVHDSLDHHGRDAAFRDFVRRGFDSGVQLDAMNAEGIEKAVMFPTRGFYALGKEYDDDGLAAAIARAWNDWMAEFCSRDPARMFAVGLVAPQSVELAIHEVRRMKRDLGFKGVYLRPNPVRKRNWNNPAYDPLWREAETLGMPVCFHEGWPHQLPVAAGDRFDGRHEDLWMTEHVLCHPVEMMYAATCMIMGGVLERFPALKVAFLEANCSWAPYLLWRMDEHFEHRESYAKKRFSRLPSEYFKRQCFVAIEADEHMGVEAARRIGSETVVFSTDFPHEDSRWPRAKEAFLKLPFDAAERRRILWDNPARLYGIG
ncbi:MAG: hypothetical protein FJX51_08460 [Alphaproteobacteria bacterium]|nr:hypothetical protein [Alphaproteobacteria bacterium]